MTRVESSQHWFRYTFELCGENFKMINDRKQRHLISSILPFYNQAQDILTMIVSHAVALKERKNVGE